MQYCHYYYHSARQKKWWGLSLVTSPCSTVFQNGGTRVTDWIVESLFCFHWWLSSFKVCKKGCSVFLHNYEEITLTHYLAILFDIAENSISTFHMAWFPLSRLRDFTESYTKQNYPTLVQQLFKDYQHLSVYHVRFVFTTSTISSWFSSCFGYFVFVLIPKTKQATKSWAKQFLLSRYASIV